MSIIIIIIIIAVLQSSAELRVSDIIINNKAGLTIPIVQLCNVVIIFFQEGWLSVMPSSGWTDYRERRCQFWSASHLQTGSTQST